MVKPAMEIGAMMKEAACPKLMASKIIPTVSGMAIKMALHIERYRKNAALFVQHARQLENKACATDMFAHATSTGENHMSIATGTYNIAPKKSTR